MSRTKIAKVTAPRRAWNSPIPGPHVAPWVRQPTRDETRELMALEDGICWLCRRRTERLVREHDHEVGMYATRGLTCCGCNSHMAGIDRGKYAIDPVTRLFLTEPWHLKRSGQELSYDPVIHIRVSDLSAADRNQLDWLTGKFGDDKMLMRVHEPTFQHPHVAELMGHGEFRHVLRLRVMNKLGLHDFDIAEMGERRSSFQKGQLLLLLGDVAP
jgi:hypothetical protein